MRVSAAAKPVCPHPPSAEELPTEAMRLRPPNTCLQTDREEGESEGERGEVGSFSRSSVQRHRQKSLRSTVISLRLH